MTRTTPGREALLLVLALAALAAPPPARAQIFVDEVPTYQIKGRLLLSYAGTWSHPGPTLLQTHLLSEGVDLESSGWIYQSRFIRFRAHVLVLRTQLLSPHQPASSALGYGGSLLLFSRSILPISLSAARGVFIQGSSPQAAGVGTTTSFAGTARLVAPDLPKADVSAQHLSSQDVSGAGSVSDAVSAGVYGASALQRYQAVVNWTSNQYGASPRSARTLASVSDDVYFGGDTRARLQATLTRGSGLGGAEAAGVTGYEASGNVLTRLGARTLFRAGGSYSTLDATDRSETSQLASSGATIDLRPLPVLLGEGLALGRTEIDAPGLHRVLDAASFAQGVAVSAQRGPATTTLSGTGQLGYTEVSDGRSGLLAGYGLVGGLRVDVPRAPVQATAQLQERRDFSSAGTSTRLVGATASSTMTPLLPLTLLPAVTFFRLSRTDPLSDLTSDTSSLAASLTGSAPVKGTAASFIVGYADTWSDSANSHNASVFAHLADAFRLAPRTFGNLAVDGSRTLGQATNAALLGSLLWSFRESMLSLNYSYSRTWPSTQGGQHALGILFSRGFEATFLPESR